MHREEGIATKTRGREEEMRSKETKATKTRRHGEEERELENKMRKTRRFSAMVAVGLLVVFASTADAAEIRVLCSNGIKAVMEELVPQFEKATKHKVIVKFGLAAALRREIEAGEPFDMAILTPQMIDEVIKGGKVAGDTRTVVARSGLALFVRAGAPKVDISTSDAFKRALVNATSVAYAKEGASGVFFAELIQRLGIAEQMKAKSQLTASGEAAVEAVAQGKAQFGVLPVSEILPAKGVDLVGTFPADVQSYIVMVAGVGSKATQRAAATELIKFLTGPAALPTIKKGGMER